MSAEILIVYYSHSMNTRKLARLIGQKTGGKLCELVPETAYPAAYNAVVEQAKNEIRSGFRPALKTSVEDIEAYGTIFIGTPNWWSTVAPPVATFLESCDLAGKQVIPFCTHGGGGFGRIESDIAKLCPGATVLPGLAIYGDSVSESRVSDWLNKLGVIMAR